MAILVASMISWLVKDALPAPAGVPLPMMIASLVWIVVFVLVRRTLIEMRPGE